jgi:hypothetical protein
MPLKILRVINGKTPEEEFVWLYTDADVNLYPYAVVDRTFLPDGGVSNEFRHIFVFPNLKIGKCEQVKLFTGPGTNTRANMTGKPGCYVHKLFGVQRGMCME